MSSGQIFVISLVSISGAFILLIVLAGGFFELIKGRRKSRTLSDEESQMLEELWTGLQKMESRIENLETILIHRERKQ